jgi:hypothetical protein
MHRELNPELFGVKSLHDDAPLGLGSSGQSRSTGSDLRLSAQTALEMKSVETQIHQLRLQLQAAEKRNELLTQQFQEFVRASTSRFERTHHTMQRLESGMVQQVNELNAKYSGISSKVNERKVQDVKVQEMIDRHNNIVRSFENRLTHMQRVLGEQEMQLHNSQAALEEARHELARLKQR